MTKSCRICETALAAPDYVADAPSITSMATAVELPLTVHVCRTCGHAQSSELPDLASYYDTTYQISLTSNDHDQLYEIADGVEVYRTDKQASLVLDMASVPAGARVLDYGAAKAATLRKIMSLRSDIEPHVFDVSSDYAGHWATWLAQAQSATYVLPNSWNGRFDLVMAHFVLEHVAEPIAILSDLRRMLGPKGQLFLSVPDALSNPGDLLVADHINHFSKSSLFLALQRAGFRKIHIEDEVLRGALIVIAEAGEASHPAASDETLMPFACADALEKICHFWLQATQGLDASAVQNRDRPCAIYGAGFYGSFIATRIGRSVDIACFVDRNPHVRAQPHMGRPVVAPSDLPTNIDLVYAGLNPATARTILSDVPEWRARSVRVAYLDPEASSP